MYFQRYWFRKIWLDKCLKSHVSEDPETDNMENVSKLCCNLNGRNFKIFVNHFEGSCIGRSLF